MGDVALREDGTFVALFVDGDLDALVTAAEAHVAMKNGVVGLGGLAAATSEDGVSWTRADLTFDQPMPPYVVDPEILDTGAGYVLYFLAMDVDELCADTADPFNVPGTHRLLRAESDDLLHWSHVTEAYANPSGGTDPTVWCVDSSRCYGWFSASLVSTDGGATFGPTGDLHLPGTPQIPDVVELDDGSWRMYFLGNSGIELYGSDDGATWKAGGGTGQAAGSPSVLVDAGVLTMWVSGPS